MQKLLDKGLCDVDESGIPCGLELCEFNVSAVLDCVLLGSCTASAVPEGVDHSLSHLCFVLQQQ